jgi:hypothetical protein
MPIAILADSWALDISTIRKDPIMSSTNIYTPFTYLIGWSKLDIWYYGVRFAKNTTPKDLWTVYFTSSKHVTNFRKMHGEPDVISIRREFTCKEDALSWEHKVLHRMKIGKNKRFLNVSTGYGDYFHDATGLKQSEDHVAKRAAGRRGKGCPISGRLKIGEKAKGKIVVIDKLGNKFKVNSDDPSYLSGEYVGHTKGYFCAKDSNGNKFQITKEDPRYISGELVAESKGRIPKNKKPLSPEDILLNELKQIHNIVYDRKTAVWINNGSTRSRVMPQLYELYYKSNGWNIGR